MSKAIGRPPSTVAYPVGILVEADMLKVVRTRRVRTIDERFYGRTARVFYVGPSSPSSPPNYRICWLSLPPTPDRPTRPTGSELS